MTIFTSLQCWLRSILFYKIFSNIIIMSIEGDLRYKIGIIIAFHLQTDVS